MLNRNNSRPKVGIGNANFANAKNSAGIKAEGNRHITRERKKSRQKGGKKNFWFNRIDGGCYVFSIEDK
jgi:hypothetical protein